jgi:hypothetical protein
MEVGMRKAWIGAALTMALALAGVGPLSAQQTQSTQPSIANPDQPDQATPPPSAKSTHHARTRSVAPASQVNPDLDADDQLAPSQMKQPMPAAVAEPTGPASHKPAHPVMHAAATAAAPDAAAPVAAKPVAAARPTPARAASASARVVTCIGAFSKDSSHLRLAMTYDSKNIAFTEVEANGGSKVPASVLFPNDPKQRLEVWWSNPASRSDTYLIDIHGKSIWSGPDGMKLGLTLEQLEKLNHKPFKLKGFDKDGTATVSDWDGGTLATLPGGCKSGVSLRADPKVSADIVSALAADHEFSSTDPAIRAAKPTVSEILIGY